MIAIVRTREGGRSKALCELDIMNFTESQVRDRMEERGIKDDTFFICGFSDWGIDRTMSLSESYLLKKCINELYDGDDYVVRFLLVKGYSIFKIVSQYYQYISKDEIKVMRYLLKNADFDSVLEFWFKTKTWANAVDVYIENGVVLNTEKGFYVRKLEGG
ncbi:TPA: hypothetical protein U3Q82_001159 [Streptococcus agalactiae]|uniref:Uncharacterized protein n=1 Tax=Streptococcus porcinus TaxID=1340 RepID=A0A7V9WSH4_STRPO|nr:hypothetical protein [Streptococcus porcinus]HEN0128870.1 hypothetical protein [Streptococcus agalactiae]MBA2796245.1 hypothetical protein [Streptococcus porcinus]HEN0669351.1 hypothetical protein [Streptococcus agalactiae]HEN0679271.1 hypothetical protein [Streptococcus agalactiae]HEN0765024.1 hypothetical protein [Streptococcus agalactiae]